MRKTTAPINRVICDICNSQFVFNTPEQIVPCRLMNDDNEVIEHAGIFEYVFVCAKCEPLYVMTHDEEEDED